jgi:hypothetical protein
MVVEGGADKTFRLRAGQCHNDCVVDGSLPLSAGTLLDPVGETQLKHHDPHFHHTSLTDAHVSARTSQLRLVKRKRLGDDLNIWARCQSIFKLKGQRN